MGLITVLSIYIFPEHYHKFIIYFIARKDFNSKKGNWPEVWQGVFFNSKKYLFYKIPIKDLYASCSPIVFLTFNKGTPICLTNWNMAMSKHCRMLVVPRGSFNWLNISVNWVIWEICTCSVYVFKILVYFSCYFFTMICIVFRKVFSDWNI